jgi:transcriptional regulator with XRE-family HTH domain
MTEGSKQTIVITKTFGFVFTQTMLYICRNQPLQNDNKQHIMSTNFGNKLAKLRKEQKMSQSELAKTLKTSTSVIGRYERDEVRPTIDVVKKLAHVLETTAGYLLGETQERELLKDPSMLKRLNDIAKFSQKDKEHILYTLDAMINNVKLKAI